MDPLIQSLKSDLAKVVDSLKEDLKTIRTGHANPVIVEQLVVDAYGGTAKLKLMEVATITTEGPSTIVIVPFDPGTVPDIEKAILKSPLGLSPQVQGTKLLIRLPALSEEQREKYVRLAGQKVEERRNMIRNIRDEVRKKIKSQFELKELSEDAKFRLEKEVDAQSQSTSEAIVEVRQKKEAEIRQV